MHITITIPGLLFPAISLLFLAYTNRFLALAALIRELYRRRQSEGSDLNTLERIDRQIGNLKVRVELIRSMQSLGIFAFISCTASMFAIFLDWQRVGAALFGLSLLMLVFSLLQSYREIKISVGALEILLEDLGQHAPKESRL